MFIRIFGFDSSMSDSRLLAVIDRNEAVDTVRLPEDPSAEKSFAGRKRGMRFLVQPKLDVSFLILK